MAGQEALERWLPEAMARVHKAAGDTAAGTAEQPYLLRGHAADEPVFIVIYAATPDGAATRTIPAHREAYVRVQKRTVQSGGLGDVYGGIGKWIEDQGLQVAAAPRETYWTDVRPPLSFTPAVPAAQANPAAGDPALLTSATTAGAR
jgi:hypothetical protein